MSPVDQNTSERVGLRIHGGVPRLVGALVLILLFGYALSWIFATVGIMVGDPETAQAAAFPVLAPLIFASAAFVPVASMHGWLQPFASNQPFSATVEAFRALVLGTPAATHVLTALVRILAILVVFIPLPVWRYGRAV